MDTAPPPAIPQPQASISAFGRDGFTDRRTDGTRGLWVRAITGRWYYARFNQPCTRLPDEAGIRFETSPLDTLDKDSAVIAGGQYCRFDSLTQSPPPPSPPRR